MSLAHARVVKLWVDDIRPAPTGWLWARTNDDAKQILQEQNVQEISLDCDMGLHYLEPKAEHRDMRGRDPDNGIKLVEWMVENKKVPKHVVIHSWNLNGARQMYKHLNAHGYQCMYEAYTPGT